MFTKGMAIDWGQFGINVNGIGPGYFKTELNQKLVDDPQFLHGLWAVPQAGVGAMSRIWAAQRSF